MIAVEEFAGRFVRKVGAKMHMNRQWTGYRLWLCAALLFVAALAATGCDRKPESRGPQFDATPRGGDAPTYRFAVHPLHNPAKLVQAYQPLVEYLNAGLQPARLVLEASRDYADFEAKYQARKLEFILPNPWQTLQAMKVGYGVIAMAGDPADFLGLFIVRGDGGIGQPADLKGKAVSYPSPTALAACIMPQYYLHTHGIDVNADIENRYVGSQESSIMNVWLGKTAAGATWPPPWRAFLKEHPDKAADLVVAWETESLVNNAVMARDDVPPEIRDKVRALLLALAESPEGAAILAGMETAGFFPADDADYDTVRSYVGRFEREVRPVEALP